MKLDFIQTLAFAGLVLFIGEAIRNRISLLSRYNIPVPIIGCFLISLAVSLTKHYHIPFIEFDLTLKEPLMIAFFTTIGFGASFSLLKTGGKQVVLFLVVAIICAVLQNVIGILIAILFGIHPLFGVLCGSVALTGGPATASAFGSKFESFVAGGTTASVAIAVAGIVAGGLISSPIATFLITKHKLKTPKDNPQNPSDMPLSEQVECYTEDLEYMLILKNFVLLLVAMGIGVWVSYGFSLLKFTLPSYIGSMLVAAILRNYDDKTHHFKLSIRFLNHFGNIALSLFLTLALMTLKLQELTSLALPMFVILVAQVGFIALVCLLPMFRTFGKDYDSAVMLSGFCGFMLGTTANAMASMKALVERYGPSPKAFLIVPIVGACFIDFANALIITGCFNLWQWCHNTFQWAWLQ